MSNLARTCIAVTSVVTMGALCDGSGVPCSTGSPPTTPANRSRRWRASSGSAPILRCPPTRTPSAPRRAWSRRSGARRRAPTSTPMAARTELREALGRRLGVPPELASWSATAPTSCSACWRARRLRPRRRGRDPAPGLRALRDRGDPVRRHRRARARSTATSTDLDDMLARVTPRTKAVIICTPHNPAATIVPAPAARALPRRPRRRPAARDPRRGVQRFLRRCRHRGRRGARSGGTRA